jgi:hypothetical protein
LIDRTNRSDQLPVPATDCVGSDERRNFAESPTPDGFASNREPATLIVGQPESSTSELLLEDAVLFSEIFDDCVLFTTDPAMFESCADGC